MLDWSKFEALVFDLDYTLIDSSEGIVYCFNEARRRAGEAEVAPELLKARIGLPIEDGFRVFGSKDPPAMRELFRAIARDGEMERRSWLLPGVAEAIPALARRKRLAVASTKSRPEIERVLLHLGLHQHFETFVGSDEVRDPKPAPDSLRLIMARMKLAPEQLLYVGDHVVDVRAARAAGVRVVAIEGGPYPLADLLAERPDLVLKSVAELVRMRLEV